MEEKNTSIAFEEYDDSHRADFDRVQQLRAQLAVVDRYDTPRNSYLYLD